MLEKIYKELTLMGIIALSIIMISAGGAGEVASEWIFTFEYAHIVTFFTTMFFVVHALFSMYHSYGYHRITVHMSWFSENELLEAIQKQNWLTRLWYDYAPFFNHTRETVEYKCVELLFCDTYWLPSKFDVPMYVSGCFERYALKTVNVGIFNWSVLAVLITLNYMRIKLHLGFNCIDPEAYSDSLITSTTNSDIGNSISFANTTNAMSEPVYFHTVSHRLLGASMTIPVERVCYDRMTYFVFICALGLVVFTLCLLGVARVLEKRLLRRVGVRNSRDYETLLKIMIEDRDKRDKSEKECGFVNDGRASIEQLFEEIEECADEHEQEEEEERVYKDFLFHWSQVSYYVYELFERLNKPFRRWINKRIYGKNKIGDASRILETSRVIAKSSKNSIKDVHKDSRVSAKFNRVAELKKKLEQHHKEVGGERTARDRLSFLISEGGFNARNVLSPSLLLHGVTDDNVENAQQTLRSAEELASNTDSDDEIGLPRAKSVELSPAQSTSAKHELLPAKPESPSPSLTNRKHLNLEATDRPTPEHRESELTKSGWNSHKNRAARIQEAKDKLQAAGQHVPSSLIGDAMERRKSITAARRKSIFSLSSKPEPTKVGGTTVRRSSNLQMNTIGRALSGQLLASHKDIENANANSTLAKFRETLDARYLQEEAANIGEEQGITRKIAKRMSKLTSKVDIDRTRESAASKGDADDAESGSAKLPTLSKTDSQIFEDHKARVRNYNFDLYSSDMESIYIFQNPEYYYRAVEACIMMHCFYLGIWSTNFLTIVSESTLNLTFWHIFIIVPLFLLSIPALASINKISNKIDAVAHMNLAVMLETVKLNLEATDQSNNLREAILERVSLESIGFGTDEEKLLLVDSLFGAVDIDSSGTIDQYELRVLLKQLDLSFSDARFHVLFSAIDIEAVGYIKKYEFYNLLFPSCRQELRELRQYYEYEGKRTADEG